MQQQYETLDSLRLVTEHENLDFVLSHAELSEDEQSWVKRRLAVVEEELIQLLTSDFPM